MASRNQPRPRFTPTATERGLHVHSRADFLARVTALMQSTQNYQTTADALGLTTQQLTTQLQAAGVPKKDIRNLQGGGANFLQRLLNAAGQSGVFLPIEGAGIGGTAATDTATAGGATAAEAGAGSAAGGGLFSKLAGSISTPVEFLGFIAWIFHPRMLLRAVEFLVGLVLMIFGLHAAFQARGERLEGFSTSESALTRSGLGRVATELGRATRAREKPRRPRSASYATRRRALQQRYSREEDLQRRRASAPRPKKK